MNDKFGLMIKLTEKIGDLEKEITGNPYQWCRTKFPHIYDKIGVNDARIDKDWDVLTFEELRELVKEKYNKIRYIIGLYVKQGGK